MAIESKLTHIELKSPPLHWNGLRLGDTVVEDTHSGAEHDHRADRDRGRLPIYWRTGRSVARLFLSDRRRHIRLSVVAGYVCGEVFGLYCSFGYRTSLRILQTDAKLIK